MRVRNDPTDYAKVWGEKAKALLLNKRIVNVRYLTQEEADDMGWDERTVAFQTQLLGIKPFDKILEVGTGSAYQACILAELKAKVFTIERQKKLFEGNKNFKLLTSSLSIKTFYGDGFEGLPTYAPFDKVLITAAAPFIPQKLIEQLKPGGIMVIPLNEGENQRMLRITKSINGDLIEERFSEFSFVPMLGGKKE